MPAQPVEPPAVDPSVEDAVDALEDGDRAIRPGTARAALQHKVFRRVFIGAFLSNIGSWMQNVVLGALGSQGDGGAIGHGADPTDEVGHDRTAC